MSPNGLLFLSGETLRERVRLDPHAYPVAAPAERKWAGVACVVTICVATVLAWALAR